MDLIKRLLKTSYYLIITNGCESVTEDLEARRKRAQLRSEELVRQIDANFSYQQLLTKVELAGFREEK